MNAIPESSGPFPDRLRPDLPIPLAPEHGLAALVRAALTGLRTPAFAEAHRLTVRTGAVLFTVVAVGRFAMVGVVRPWIYAVAGVTVGVVAIRAAALARAERRQRRFQERWLLTRTEALRRTAFEIIRFTVVPSPASGMVTVWDAAAYDLTKPDDVRALTARQAAERRSGRAGSRVVIEFCYDGGDGGTRLVEEAWSDLDELSLRTTAARLVHAVVVFPDACYHARPAIGWRGRNWPARETFWTLGTPAVSAVVPSW
ncbi:hypothetical protein ABH935_004179 [Catenulispora sp. GAS73]|uniref:hypothetical protein n=1 Tax=Catenulispora sp. GAS73 TaxID=3156269 RepID=UPI0035131E25